MIHWSFCLQTARSNRRTDVYCERLSWLRTSRWSTMSESHHYANYKSGLDSGWGERSWVQVQSTQPHNLDLKCIFKQRMSRCVTWNYCSRASTHFFLPSQSNACTVYCCSPVLLCFAYSLCRKGSVQLHINKWVQINFCLPHTHKMHCSLGPNSRVKVWTLPLILKPATPSLWFLHETDIAWFCFWFVCF